MTKCRVIWEHGKAIDIVIPDASVFFSEYEKSRLLEQLQKQYDRKNDN